MSNAALSERYQVLGAEARRRPREQFIGLTVREHGVGRGQKEDGYGGACQDLSDDGSVLGVDIPPEGEHDEVAVGLLSHVDHGIARIPGPACERSSLARTVAIHERAPPFGKVTRRAIQHGRHDTVQGEEHRDFSHHVSAEATFEGQERP